MSRSPSIAELTRRLNAAKARDTALKARQQANTGQNLGKGQARPSETVKYKSIFTSQDFTLNTPKAGITFFAGNLNNLAALGLAAADASPRIARGFRPAKIKATIGREDNKGHPTESKLVKGHHYLKYSVDAGQNGVRSSYSAPISGDSTAALKSRFTAIANSKKDNVKEYGRIWFEPERPVFSVDGVVDGGVAGAGG